MITENTYIGMRSRNYDERNFEWIDGTPVDFTAWRSNNPIYYRDGKEACTILDTTWSDYKKAWMLIRCYLYLGYICKQPSHHYNLTRSCPGSNYAFFKPTNSCYLAVTTRQTFYGAEQECANAGGHLTSVHSQEESDFISELFHRSGMGMLIGLKRNQQGAFEWTDGSPLDFAPAWRTNQPALEPEENCIRMRSDSADPVDRRKWQNDLCTNGQFICACNKTIAEAPLELKDKSNSAWIIFVAIIVGIILLLGVVFLILFILRKRQGNQTVTSELHALSETGHHAARNVYKDSKAELVSEDLYRDIQALSMAKFDPRFLISYSRIGRVEHVLGSGNFGMVYSSNYQKTHVADDFIEVACKQLHSLDDEEKRTEFLIEASIMMSLRHTHIVGLHGVAFNDEKIPILVMELLSGGSLHSHLRNHETIESERLRFGKEIASGMLYLHNCNLIHRDLATRNCMLTAEQLLKIADFGLAREFHDQYTFQHKRPLPWRWTAPEAYFDQTVTAKSDVWSYGVTLWEIYSQAELPHKDIHDPHEHFKALKNGSRLGRPTDCSENLYTHMLLECWAIEPDQRPEFGDIFVEMSKRHKECLKTIDEATPADPKKVSFDEVDAGYLKPDHSHAAAKKTLEVISENDGYEVSRSCQH